MQWHELYVGQRKVHVHAGWRPVSGVIHEPRSVTSDVQATLTAAGNFVLTPIILFHGLAGNFGHCACVLHVSRYSTLRGPTQPA